MALEQGRVTDMLLRTNPSAAEFHAKLRKYPPYDRNHHPRELRPRHSQGPQSGLRVVGLT